jgi:hypothetical protein
MLVSPGTVSSTQKGIPADEAVLLEALAEAVDALTNALVAHDLAAITSVTEAAAAICERLDHLEAGPAAIRPARPELWPLAERIGAAARRNAVLLEAAWMTDAAILRLLAAAASEQEDASSAYQAPTAPQPTGWLDRQA